MVRTRFEATRDDAVVLAGTAAWDWAGPRPAHGEPVVDKGLPGAFCSPEFGRLLEGHQGSGRSTVVVTGAYASRCVAATAYGALERGFDVVAPLDTVFAHPGRPAELEEFAHAVWTSIGHLDGEARLSGHWMRHAGVLVPS